MLFFYLALSLSVRVSCGDNHYALPEETMTTLARTWHGLGSPPTELRVVDTLLNGQCFGWHMRPTKTAPHPELIGVVGDKVS